MLPRAEKNFENYKSLAIIVKHKKVQEQVTYFCTQPLYPSHLTKDVKKEV